MIEFEHLGSGKGRDYWIYWGLTSMIAAAVGGIVLPWLLKRDPLSIRQVVE